MKKRLQFKTNEIQAGIAFIFGAGVAMVITACNMGQFVPDRPEAAHAAQWIVYAGEILVILTFVLAWLLKRSQSREPAKESTPNNLKQQSTKPAKKK